MNKGIELDCLVADLVMGWGKPRHHGERLVAYENGRLVSSSKVTSGGERIDARETCRQCRSPAIRRLTTTDRGQRLVSYLCGQHAAPVIHRLNIHDRVMNPEASQ